MSHHSSKQTINIIRDTHPCKPYSGRCALATQASANCDEALQVNWVAYRRNQTSEYSISSEEELYFFLCWPSLQTFSLPCFENLSSKKYLCSIFILMPSFLFSPGLLIDFFIQFLFEWDFQGCSPPTASAGFTLVIITRRCCSIADGLLYLGQLRH